MKRIFCPYCGKELINLNNYGGYDFWCDDCNIDYIIEDSNIIIENSETADNIFINKN